MGASRFPRPGLLSCVLFTAALVLMFGGIHALKVSGTSDVREGCMAPAIPASEAPAMGGASALDATSLRGCDPSAYLVKSPSVCPATSAAVCGSTTPVATPAAPRPVSASSTP